MSFRVRAVLLLLCLMLGWPGLAEAQPTDAQLKNEFSRLFQLGWQRTRDAREGAAEQYERLRGAAPGDHRVAWAYALVQLRQLRYAEAARLLDEVIKADPQNLAARQAKVWITALTGQNDRAMAEMEQLARLLPTETVSGSAPTQHEDVTVLLGRLCGYLAGPASENVNQARLADCQRRVTAALTGSSADLFRDTRQQVLDQYAAATEDVDTTRQTSEDAAATAKAEKLQEIDQEGEQLAAETAAAEARVEEAAKKLRYELDEIAGEEREVHGRGRRIEAEASTIRHDVLVFEDRINELHRRAEEEEDPHRRQQYLNDAARWQVSRQRALSALSLLERQYADLQAQAARLQQRRAVAQGRYAGEANSAAAAHNALDRVRRQRDRVADQRVSGNTGEVAAKRRRATALSTYVPLPVVLEDEGRRLLASFD